MTCYDLVYLRRAVFSKHRRCVLSSPLHPHRPGDHHFLFGQLPWLPTRLCWDPLQSAPPREQTSHDLGLKPLVACFPTRVITSGRSSLAFLARTGALVAYPPGSRGLAIATSPR